MRAAYLIPAGIFAILFVVMLFRARWLSGQIKQREAAVLEARKKAEDAQQESNELAVLLRTKADALVSKRQQELQEEITRVQTHYETEALRLRTELEPLRKFAGMLDGESKTSELLAKAAEEATALRSEAQQLLDRSKTMADEQRAQANAKARELREHAEAVLTQSTKEAGRIVAEANERAEKIAGDAYTALRDKEHLEQAVRAIQNVVDGYGDRYIIPSRSVLDRLAADYGYTEAGEALKNAREHSRRMVEINEAAQCDYAEPSRRGTAIRFVIDAFNGRVEAILSRAKNDNVGTLEQEIRDAFSLVNLNGAAFRNAQILPAYLDSRLAELKWAVVVQELRMKDREEQRRLQEQIREEEKAKREYERAIKEAEKEEDLLRKALEKARLEVESATVEQRSKFESEIAALSQRLAEAEAKGQRAISMAQQTRAGTVYIISNVGSFGEDVFKIGMTRRLVPEDRIWELSDASVPFDFDIHAMLKSDDAPSLEHSLHKQFDELRVNQVNPRKEFFRLPLASIRDFVRERGVDAVFTMTSEAHEYRESMAISKMSPEDRAKYTMRDEEDGGDL